MRLISHQEPDRLATPTAMQRQYPIVTADQMRRIESQLFAAEMPVAALMEKVAGRIVQRILASPVGARSHRIGILVGPGHNGGDALVVARELMLMGRTICLYLPVSKCKPLTEQHRTYAAYLQIPTVATVAELTGCDLVIDGLFGFGLTRPIEGELAAMITALNESQTPVISIDLPSGIHTDTGAVLGVAVQATETLCLGLWKRACFQESALPFLGAVQLVEFGIPPQAIAAELGPNPPQQVFTAAHARASLPLPRPPVTHKYQQGHLLLICGSRRYGGSAVLAALGARASGVGMLSIAVPESLASLLVAQVPEALILTCPETATGAIASLPTDCDLSRYDAIAFGPGLTQDAPDFLTQVLTVAVPLLLDADGLNLLAQREAIATLQTRPAPTILTPHLGEFRRLFPDLDGRDRCLAPSAAATQSGAIILLKGARTAIAHPDGSLWIIPDSTPALARGGSGDVLTGLLGGLLTQPTATLHNITATAAWWHAQAGRLAAQTVSELAVDPLTLAQTLPKAIATVRE